MNIIFHEFLSGLKGHFDFAEKTYKLVIKKVYTQVELMAVSRWIWNLWVKCQKGSTRANAADTACIKRCETQAVLLPKGGFYQQTGGNWIFKVSEDGKTAYKVDIQLGRQNPDYYEVLQGLKPGDKVVTSSYENYGTMQELVLKK